MLGLLFSLGLFGGAAAKNAYDNAAMKRYSTQYDSNGNRHYIDNNGREYINGERIYNTGWTDSKGAYHRNEIGQSNGKVYTDYVCPSEQMKIDIYDRKVKWAKEHNMLCASLYHPKFKRDVLIELSTGKVVACILDYTKDGVQHYRKFYTKPDAKQWEYRETAIGDYGVEITKAEFDKMWVTPNSYSVLPSDWDVVHALLND